MPISRSQGYRMSEGKEEAAVLLVMDFFEHELGVRTVRIEDPDENYRLGDLRCADSQATVEVKGQPIGGYPQNFVEIFEDTSAGKREHHRNGFADLARILGVAEEDLALVPVERFDLAGRPMRPLGVLDHLSVSITSMTGAKAVAYANTKTKVLFLYSSTDLLHQIRRAVMEDGLCRGKGRSNEVTHAVHVPNATLRWKKSGSWRFEGRGMDPSVARGAARALIS